MSLPEFPLNPTRRVLRQFGAAWLVVFLALAARRWVGHHDTVWAPTLAMLALVVGVLGLVWPRTLRWLFVGLTALALPVGWLLSEVVLGVLFYGVITPLAGVMRLKGRDLLRRKPGAAGASYWRLKKPGADLRRYFRQY